MTPQRAIPIDDALEAADDAQRTRYERPSPYRVPVLHDGAMLEPVGTDWDCDYDGCAEEFDTLRELRTHVLDAHVLRLQDR